MTQLGKIADAIAEAGAYREQQRAEHSLFLDNLGPVVWVEDADRPGFGEGWFWIEGKFWAYNRYANGWAQHPTRSLDAEVVRALAARIQG